MYIHETIEMAIVTLKNFPFFLSITILLISAIGLFKSKNILQMIHFITIIDVICVPLAIISFIFLTDISNIKILLCIPVIAILSPTSSYFLGKAYLIKQQNNKITKENLEKLKA